ncbi:putative cytochrome b5-like heme/steroid binding domain, cytochrome b5, heme-binding protein [Helianthus annuus]|nr:putative cytochrome b5-like heme/steroid binding domain, cytochrome b5, heme-binding protein [Helianthus annuus]
MKVFDSADVTRHNNSQDCWVIINARTTFIQVYDVTKFLNDHPGGDKVLLDVAGKDASEEFEEAGHGSAARLMLDEYYVGEADLLTPSHGISTTMELKAEAHLKQQKVMEENMPSRLIFIKESVRLLFPIAVLGGVVAFILYK